MARNGRVVVQHYTTKDLYEITRAKRDTSAYFSRPSTNARARIRQLDAQIERRAVAGRRVKR